jgi:hypothetical protein
MNEVRTAVAAARFVAIAIVLVMVWYFATRDVIRSDNPFWVPDALLGVLLLTAAVLPRRLAAPSLIFAFGFASAVFSVSLSTYVVRGAFADGANHIALIAPMLVMAAWLLRTVMLPPPVRLDVGSALSRAGR